MTILAVGGEAECFVEVVDNDFAIESGVGRFDSTLSRHAMKITQAVSEIDLIFPGGAVDEAWIHMYVYQEDVEEEVDWIRFVDGSSNTLYVITMESDGAWTLRKNNSGFSDLATSDDPVVVNEAAIIDIYIKRHASTGEFTVYKDGEVVVTFTGDTETSASAFDRIRWSGLVGSDKELNLSQVIVADETTIGMKLATLAPSSNGTYSAWIGDYTDVAQENLDTGVGIETPDVDDVSSFQLSNIHSSHNNSVVVSYIIAMLGLIEDDADDTEDFQIVTRVGSTDYLSDDLGFTSSDVLERIQKAINDNPATSNPWTVQQLNSAEFGVKAIYEA